MQEPKHHDLDWLREQRAAGKSFRAIGRECGVTGQAIGDYCQRHGIIERPYKPYLTIDPDWLREQRAQRVPLKQIAKACGKSECTVAKACRHYGIKRTYLTEEEKKERRYQLYLKWIADPVRHKKMIERATAWNKAHPERAYQSSKAWAQRNAEHIRAKRRERYWKKKEEAHANH